MSGAARILVGAVETGGALFDLADGIRRSGHHVTSVVRESSALFSSYTYDVDLTWCLPWPESLRTVESPFIRFPRGAATRAARLAKIVQLILAHDVFIFTWAGISLTEGNREFPLLKRLGRRLVSIFLGSDVRYLPSFVSRYRASGGGLGEDIVQRLDQKAGGLARPLSNTRRAERFSDLILSQPNQSNLALRPYMHLDLPMRLERYRFTVPGREVPLVVHAPSSRDVKGTAKILNALQQLQREGIRFELRVLDRVPNPQVISALTEADVVIDQLYMGGYGKLALESMASGCAVATRAYDVFWPRSLDEPLWHVDADSIKPQLRQLLTDRPLRMRLAYAGRAFVERRHDHVAVARRILGLLEDRCPQYDYYPSEFAREFSLPPGEIIPDELKRMTAEIVHRWGVPDDVDPEDLIRRGLMSATPGVASSPVPRWKNTVVLSAPPQK